MADESGGIENVGFTKEGAYNYIHDLKESQIEAGCQEEFQTTWEIMICTHNLEGHKWLDSLYSIRHKWSTAFTKDTFHCEIKSTSRSESTNNVLNGLGSKTTSRFKFVEGFHKMEYFKAVGATTSEDKVCDGNSYVYEMFTDGEGHKVVDTILLNIQNMEEKGKKVTKGSNIEPTKQKSSNSKTIPISYTKIPQQCFVPPATAYSEEKQAFSEANDLSSGVNRQYMSFTSISVNPNSIIQST
ncbi:conserved hypothetical protein [Ricinus communis]|uniref:Uncharacterized protein n=1 Tax=Ricinus communis TaxID=3988 RepID=B9R956_RICCO|nr:conserved hypothetical protein [Ricinus communis]